MACLFVAAHTVLEDKMKEDASTYQEHIKDRGKLSGNSRILSGAEI